MVAPPAPPFIPARWHGGKQTPKAVVIHGTVSPCQRGGARAVARFFANEQGKTSAHYVVDPAEVIQTVGDHSVAYHCGYNQDSIAVEMCDPETGPASRWQDGNHKAMLDRSAALVAQLCLAYGIEIKRPTIADLKRLGPHGIYGHDDSRRAFGQTTHTDPIDFPWPRFMALVRKHANDLTHGTTTPTQEDDMTPQDMDKLADLVAEKMLAAEVRNVSPEGETKRVHLGTLLTNIELTGDRQNQRLAEALDRLERIEQRLGSAGK